MIDNGIEIDIDGESENSGMRGLREEIEWTLEKMCLIRRKRRKRQQTVFRGYGKKQNRYFELRDGEGGKA